MPSRSSRSKLIDVLEKRHAPTTAGKVELRENRNGDLIFEGYASTFDEYEVYGGPENWGWIERIDPHAFDKTLSENPDLVLLINHDGTPLARTKSGTLKLNVDSHGLHVEAQLDKTDPDVLALVPKMLRGDMDEMSFAFRVKQNEWSSAEGYEDDDMSYRLITELSLQKGDVSVVNYGANPNTSAGLSTVGQAVGFLANSDPGELRDANLAPEDVRRAQNVLAKLFKGNLRDADEDPEVMLQGLDATLDEMLDLVADIDVEAEPEEVGQLCALVGTADAAIDQIMDLMGIYDADDDSEGASAKSRARVLDKRARLADAKRKIARANTRDPQHRGRGELKATRAAGNDLIAKGFRIEVSGSEDSPQVDVFDASGLLDRTLCRTIASEVRAAVLGQRAKVTASKRAAASSGDKISVAEGNHAIGQTLSLDEAKEAGDVQTTISLEDAKAQTG